MEEKMAWKKPRIVEIAVGMEINSYACAEIRK
jgi:coenzyme PQQ precursor peptide PqqA